MAEILNQTLDDLSADHALFSGKIRGLVATFYENERPISGLAGLMDWRFHGAISRSLRVGAITGRVGECVYFPVSRHGITYHLILAGAGYSASPGERTSVPAETLQVLKRNLIALKIDRIGISRSDFGHLSDEAIAKQLKGASLCIVN